MASSSGQGAGPSDSVDVPDVVLDELDEAPVEMWIERGGDGEVLISSEVADGELRTAAVVDLEHVPLQDAIDLAHDIRSAHARLLDVDDRDDQDGTRLIPDGGDDEETTPVYLHQAGDGGAFCSFGLDYVEVEEMSVAVDAEISSPVEWIETQVLGTEWADEVLSSIKREPWRREDPPQVGQVVYDPEVAEILRLELECPPLIDAGIAERGV